MACIHRPAGLVAGDICTHRPVEFTDSLQAQETLASGAVTSVFDRANSAVPTPERRRTPIEAAIAIWRMIPPEADPDSWRTYPSSRRQRRKQR